MGRKVRRKWLTLVAISMMLLGTVPGSSQQGVKEQKTEGEKVETCESTVSTETPNVVESSGEEEKVEKPINIPDEEPKGQVVEEIIKQEELIVIRYGSYMAAEEDPNYKDPITGEYRMDEQIRQIKLQALEVVKEELGVELQFIQYPGDVTEVLLQSVLADDPVAEIVRIYQGAQEILLEQNILQPVDDYMHLIPHEPISIYGKKYFFHIDEGQGISPSSLLYNIAYIEQVPGLKEEGKTVYPIDLYLSGNWTWSVFKDYLEIIDVYYANSYAPLRPEKRIEAYKTDYRDATLLAMYTNGGNIYGKDGIGVSSPETIQAVAYIQDLIDQNLLKTNLIDGTSQVIGSPGTESMGRGETVFANVPHWLSGSVAEDLEEVDGSLGYVPFPRPDHMPFESIDYRQGGNSGESYALLKGIEEEKIPLALEAYFLYHQTIDALKANSTSRTVGEVLKVPYLAIDTLHPEIGLDMHQAFYDVVNRIEVYELADIVDIKHSFYKILGDSLYGVNGSLPYNVAIESESIVIIDKISQMEELLSTDSVKDNISPSISQIEDKFYAFPMGVDLSTIDFKADFQVEDNFDSALDINQLNVDYSTVDTQDVGKYIEGLVVTITDGSGNEGRMTYPVVIYNPYNTEAPSIMIKEDYKALPVGEDVSTINWKEHLIISMIDTDGIPVETLSVDASEVDTMRAGEYPIIVEVKDFAGNSTAVIIQITVE